MRVGRVRRIEFDATDWQYQPAAFPPPPNPVPFKEALATAVLVDQARSMNFSEDEADYFVYCGKRWAQEHLGLFADLY